MAAISLSSSFFASFLQPICCSWCHEALPLWQMRKGVVEKHICFFGILILIAHRCVLTSFMVGNNLLSNEVLSLSWVHNAIPAAFLHVNVLQANSEEPKSFRCLQSMLLSCYGYSIISWLGHKVAKMETNFKLLNFAPYILFIFLSWSYC